MFWHFLILSIKYCSPLWLLTTTALSSAYLNDVISGFAKVVVERCGFHHWIVHRISCRQVGLRFSLSLIVSELWRHQWRHNERCELHPRPLVLRTYGIVMCKMLSLLLSDTSNGASAKRSTAAYSRRKTSVPQVQFYILHHYIIALFDVK